uniref:Small acidic protein-like domain-containing protein n=1 Tax=Timema tahoe TaxID=61484 RepID=A0A7R9ILD1_9NEOP|nr:unnamed protein product [Timema tahoe]
MATSRKVMLDVDIFQINLNGQNWLRSAREDSSYRGKEVKPEVTVAEPLPAAGSNTWAGTTFAQDDDGKMTAKFKRLMGIKESGDSEAATSQAGGECSEIIKKQEELFTSMEMQYEVARVATHTHRGVGLGFGTFQYPR